MTLRAVVIGLGRMGQNHLRVLSDLPSVTVVGGADHDPQNGKHAHRAGSSFFADHRRMLDELKPDVAVVCVPSDFHAAVSIDALQAGCHVLVEKPIAPTIPEAERMIACAEACDRILMVGHVERFNPVVTEIARRLHSGELGRVFKMHARRLSPFPTRIQDVGVTLDLATHDIDAMHLLVGETPTRAFAETSQRVHSTREDMISGVLRFPGGAIGVLDVSWMSPKKVRQLWVSGEGGTYIADYLTQDMHWCQNGRMSDSWGPGNYFSGAVEGDEIKTWMPKREPLRVEHEAFLDAVLNRTASPCSGPDGLAALRVALALVKSGEAGEVIHL